MVDINLDHAPPLFDNSTQADAMKDLCAAHYGHAGPEFLKRVKDLTEGWKSLDRSLIGLASTPIAERVRARFVLVWHTGVLAVRAGILPWTEDQILSSVRIAYHAWLEQAFTVSDTERGVIAVAEFIMADESRFEFGGETYPVRNRAGWKRNGLYHFTSSAFKEACAGSDQTKVKRSLKDAGLLHITKSTGLTSVIKVEGQNVSVVSVKAEILSTLPSDGSSGSGSSAPNTTRDTAATTLITELVASGSSSTRDITYAPTATTSIEQVVAPGNHDFTEQLPPLPTLPPTSNKSGSTSREVLLND